MRKRVGSADTVSTSRYQIERPAGDAVRKFSLRTAGNINQHQPDTPQVEAALKSVKKGNRLTKRLVRPQ